MQKIVFLLILTAQFQLSQAQDDWLVTTKYDTLTGKIFVNHGGKYAADEVQIKIAKKKSMMKSYEVFSVHFEDGRVLETIKFEGRYQLVEVMKKGKYLTWYRYADTESSSTQYSSNLLMKNTGGQQAFSNIGFKKRISSFLEDCETVSVKIENGDYGIKKVNDIVDDYNACIANEQKAAVPPVVEVISASSSPLDDLIEEVKNSSLSANEDLINMLEDANQKLGSGKSVPSYLQQGIIAEFGEEKELMEKFLKGMD